ncbi:MAG: hypothetical protein QXK12_05105 [Candidatus Nezhaarchaeales archaeon]
MKLDEEVALASVFAGFIAIMVVAANAKGEIQWGLIYVNPLNPLLTMLVRGFMVVPPILMLIAGLHEKHGLMRSVSEAIITLGVYSVSISVVLESFLKPDVTASLSIPIGLVILAFGLALRLVGFMRKC